MDQNSDTARAAATRQALIAAGMRLFGSHGFAGSSIRAIAAEAGTNSASIDYHFGGKEGLRRACAETVASRLAAVIEPVLRSAGEAPDAVAARRTIDDIIAAMAGFLLTERGTEDFVPFMLREISQPGEAFELVYGRVIEPVHRHVCRLWAVASGGEAESEETRLQVFAMFGQLLYFRIGREIVRRRMGWKAMTGTEAGRIAGIVRSNISAVMREAGRAAP